MCNPRSPLHYYYLNNNLLPILTFCTQILMWILVKHLTNVDSEKWCDNFFATEFKFYIEPQKSINFLLNIKSYKNIIICFVYIRYKVIQAGFVHLTGISVVFLNKYNSGCTVVERSSSEQKMKRFNLGPRHTKDDIKITYKKRPCLACIILDWFYLHSNIVQN